MVCSVTPSYRKVFKYNKNLSVIMILKSAAASQSALRWSCQPLQCLGRLNEVPGVENKPDFPACPRAAPSVLQGLSPSQVCVFLHMSNFQHCCFPAGNSSHGILKVGKDQGAFCPCSPLFLEQWLSLCNPCLASAAQGGEQDNPKAPVLAALILHWGLGK